MHDVLVVGLGAMGSAALYHLAARGRRVVGVDAFDPPHSLGSTHGRTRIIREAYFEHPSYVPLVRRAYANWAELETKSGVTLFQRTGGLMMGAPDSGVVLGALESATQHGIDVETLSAAEIMRRFPAFIAEQGMIGAYEQRAGMLFPEACVRAYLGLAQALGAELRTNTRVLALSRKNGVVVAETSNGTIAATQVVMAAGAWTNGLLESLGVSLPLTVERQTMHWLSPAGDRDLLRPERFPIALIEYEPNRFFYALPDVGDGVKAAIHYEGAFVNAESVNREVSDADRFPVMELARRFIPAAAGAIRESAVCLYTNTPDLHFIVDAAPGMPNVIVVSACSGHGFKFASAIGEAVAAMAVGETTVDVAHFRVDRWDQDDRKTGRQEDRKTGA
jgi:sarcosine oxidase